MPATFYQADHKLPANQLIWVNPGTFNIKPGKSIGLQINYRPLNISSVDDMLVLMSKKLGEFSYSLKLSGVANENVRTVLFKTEIGQSTITPIKLQSFLTRPVTYQLKIITRATTSTWKTARSPALPRSSKQLSTKASTLHCRSNSTRRSSASARHRSRSRTKTSAHSSCA